MLSQHSSKRVAVTVLGCATYTLPKQIAINQVCRLGPGPSFGPGLCREQRIQVICG